MTPTHILAAGLTEISLSGVVLLIVNILIGLAVAIIGWSLRRLVDRNDDEHAAQTTKLDTLARVVEAEREARHQLHNDLSRELAETNRTLGDRVWGVNADLKENYQTRREGLRLYGNLAQKLDANQRELLDKLDGLPCKEASCPGEKA